MDTNGNNSGVELTDFSPLNHDFQRPAISVSVASSIGTDDDGNTRPKLNRAISIKQTITKNTLDFLGLADEEEDRLAKEKWQRRRARLVSRYGKVKGSLSAPMTPDVVDGGFNPFAQKMVNKVRKQNAAKLLWRSASRRMSAKPTYDVPTIRSFGGRSFAPADLNEDDISVFSSTSDMNNFATPVSSALPTPSLLDDQKFFFFDQPSHITEESFDRSDMLEDTTDQLDITDDVRYAHIPPSDPVEAPPSPSQQIVSGWDSKKLGQQPVIESPKAHRQRIHTERVYMPATERRNRIQDPHIKVKKKKKERREFGKGFVGQLLNRTLKRKRLTSNVKEQLDNLDDYRPYFTYWLSFVQVIILIVMVSVYSFAPIGVSQRTIQKDVLVSRNGLKTVEAEERKIVESFWIGPSLETLIHLGAKYAPCMRHDTRIYKQLRKERSQENETGCCLSTYNTGCIQSHQRQCSSSFTKFARNTVCDQDPGACLDPASEPPNEWDKSIINWPTCRKTVNVSSLNMEQFPHMRCEVIGRPCCIGTQAECVIQSKAFCDLHEGTYHPDKTLCNQVDCLSSTCGLLPFLNENEPDQFYRLWLSLFLNAGLIHLAIILFFNYMILRDIEKMAGWVRTAIIFLLSGMGGNLWSSTLLPYAPDVGPAGSCFGMIACLFVEVIQAWQVIERPWKALAKMCSIVFMLFLFGLLPYIDNFAHMFGFIYGFLLALIFLPYVTFGAWDRKRKQIQILVAVILLVVITIVGFVLFYEIQEFKTESASYINCIPISDDFCKDFQQGQQLSRRPLHY